MIDDENVLAALCAIVGNEKVLTAAADTEPYYTDWTGRTKGRALAVCLPESTEEVAAVVAMCTSHGVPVFPQSGNTSSCGGSVPLLDGRGILLSLRRMKAILDIDARGNALTVEAGCTLAEVQEAARSADRLFPLTLGSEGSCMIGGNVATNAGGTSVLRYGNMRDLVLGLEVVLADGRIWNGPRTLRKDNTGYDMKSLFIGSEGTLGVITKVVLRLFPLPRARATAMVAIPTPQAAEELLGRCQNGLGSMIEAFELLSASQIDLVLRHVPGNRNPFEARHAWYVLIEIASSDADANLDAALEWIVATAIEDGLVEDAVIAQSLRQTQELWRIRHSVSESNRAHGLNFTHDVAVPIARIAEFLARADALTTQNFPDADIACVSHMGDGNVHYTVTFPYPMARTIVDPSALGGKVTRMIHDLAIELGGSFAAEHGIGQRYRDSLRRYKSPVELEMFNTLKAAFDPKRLLNPGKLL